MLQVQPSKYENKKVRKEGKGKKERKKEKEGKKGKEKKKEFIKMYVC